jgi:hypothetical protein
MIDTVGRRRLMIIFALAMCVVLCCEAITVAIGDEKAGIAAVFFVFLFEGCFTWGTFLFLVSLYLHDCLRKYRMDVDNMGLSS